MKNQPKKTICCFCSSSDAVNQGYFQSAMELGELIGKNNYNLIYGGSKVGLMGAIARSAQKAGSRIVAVIPKKIEHVLFREADEIIWTGNLRDRKQIMSEKADAFIALPGGFGTLEEVMEVLTLKQLQYHRKPVVFLNTQEFYSTLSVFLERLYRDKFAKPDFKKYYHFASTPAGALKYLETYEAPGSVGKWF